MKNSFLDNIKVLMNRELNQLSREISLYKSEENIWVIGKEIANTAGNLTLHICGNLQHFIGNILGNSGYKRNREYEFSAKSVKKSELLKEIETTKDMVNSALQNLPEKEILQDYPQQVLGYKMSKQYFLIHLHGHLNYHLGQINYHRRLLD